MVEVKDYPPYLDYPLKGKPEKCKSCGGTLSEIRYHNGRPLRHCYSCHFEFYEEAEDV